MAEESFHVQIQAGRKRLRADQPRALPRVGCLQILVGREVENVVIYGRPVVGCRPPGPAIDMRVVPGRQAQRISLRHTENTLRQREAAHRLSAPFQITDLDRDCREAAIAWTHTPLMRVAPTEKPLTPEPVTARSH